MPIRHTVLAILNVVPLHGYAVRQLVRGYRFFYPMRNANVYDVLRRLEAEGLVTHEEQRFRGRLRKVYSITDAGRAEFRRWLADSTPQPGVYRDPLVLKICLLTPETLASARPWIREELDRCRAAIELGERRIARRSAALTRYTRLGAEYALDQARLRERWLQSVLEAIQEDTAGAASRGGDTDPDQY